MSDSNSFIEHPPLPKLPTAFYKAFEKIENVFKNIRAPKPVIIGLTLGLIFAIIALLFDKNKIRGMISGFVVGFIVGSLFDAIIESMPNFSKYSTGKKVGIIIGFFFAFLAFAGCMMALDIYVLNDRIYRTLETLLLLREYQLPTLFSSIKNNFTKILDKIISAFRDPQPPATDYVECIKKYAGMLAGATAVSVLLFYASRDPSALTSSTNSYALIMMIPLIVGFLIFSPLIKAKDSPYLMALGGGLILLFSALYFYYSTTWTAGSIFLGGFYMRLLLALIAIIGMALFFKMFSGQLKKMSGWSGFFVNLLFYLPCLFSDSMQYLLQQFKITPNIVLLLLVIEIILVLIYVYVPVILQKISEKYTTSVQQRPVFLNKLRTLGDSNMFLYKPLSDDVLYASTDQLYRRNYGISMWIYLNPHSNSNAAYVDGTNIFSYGDGKPRITYKNDSGNKRQENVDIYTIYFSNTDDSAKYDISLPNQKWNMFTFNYFDSKVDLYINGTLERTFEFTDNIPSYSASDSIAIGSENGLDGSLCNLNYYKQPLTDLEIATNYNLLALKNPPVDYI